MKLEVTFESVKDLIDQLDLLIEQLGGSYTEPKDNNQLEIPIDYGDKKFESSIGQLVSLKVNNPPTAKIPDVVMTENPVVAPITEAPKKRTRRTKEQIEAEKNKPVETAPVVEQPTLPEVVAPVVETAPELETPKNFYSPSEFVSNFVIIVNNLLNNGSLGIGDIEDACKYYDVKLIYMVGKDLAMCEHFYNDLVSRQIITKKGDY